MKALKRIIDLARFHYSLSSIGSINGYIGVLGTDAVNYPEDVPAGSLALQNAYFGYFANRNLNAVPSPTQGAMDTYAFRMIGIPYSGIWTGDRAPLTPEGENVFSLDVGAPMDPNWHTINDDCKSPSPFTSLNPFCCRADLLRGRQ